MTDARRGFWLATLAFLPLFVWWLGWFPGFLSSDSIDQLNQVETGDYTNSHPAAHTITYWLVTRLWDHPGAISLVQILLLTLVLAIVAKRLIELGVPLPLAVGTTWLVSLLPAVGPTAISLWKDVAFTIAFLWVVAELLHLTAVGDAYWTAWNGPLRLAGALSLVWLFRHNGLLTVILILTVLAWLFRSSLRGVAITVLALLVIVAAVQGPVLWLFSVDRSQPVAAEVLLPVVASSYVHEPSNFSADELELLARIAPLDVWRSQYDCDRANALLFDPEMNIHAIRSDPAPFFRLGVRTLIRDLDTSLGMLWCRASFLFQPGQPTSSYLQRPPFAIPTNDAGIERNPVWSGAYEATLDVFSAAESGSWLWLAWRPAVVIWATIATFAVLAWKRQQWLLLPGALLAIHLVNVAGTSLNHEFRLAFPLYVGGLMCLPLLWFAAFPRSSHRPVGGLIRDDRSLLDQDVAPVGSRKR